MINGVNYDWEGIEISLPQGTAVAVRKIEYSDEKDLKEVYGKGSMPQAVGRGNYKAEGKLTLAREEFERLVGYCQRQKVGALYQLPAFTITVGYSSPDRPTITDRLLQCMFKKRSTSIDQGAEKVDVELEFVILGGIEWNGARGDAAAVVGQVLDAVRRLV